jgi:septum formation protein
MLILASASPRRQELLRLITANFKICPADADESLPSGTPPLEAAKTLAVRKAEAVAAKYPGDVVIGADTIVAIDGEILGKPTGADDAARMLRKLSGRTHAVVTGVCIAAAGVRHVFAESTDVTFVEIPEDDIISYAHSGEPLDKAGAYAIQGGAAKFASHICGDYSNIVGLPLAKLNLTLKTLNLI